jgi:uncharacterized protein (UPF0210 family)
MRIRAITIGQIVPFLFKNETLETFMEEKLENFANFNEELVERFEDINLIVETKRLCSQPLFSYEEQRVYQKNLEETIQQLNNQLSLLQGRFKKYGIDYFACCSMLADELKDFGLFEKLLLREFPRLLQNYNNLFTSLPAASTRHGINLEALKSGAKMIKMLSSPDPFNNLQFCVSSNVKPNTPFFPAAYHFSDTPAFSIAMEMADEVSRVFRNAPTLTDAKLNLKAKFEEIYNVLLEICEDVGQKYNIEFSGMDFSPAPFPKLTRSIGYAVEKLKLGYFGAPGSLIAIAIIKNCIPKREKVIGFSGFMQPVLEDYIIAKRLEENKFNLDTLLLYSTVCGTGLDTVPLPGDITEKELFAILLDICTVSVMLEKPLTARLMPIPGKKAGDPIEFDFEYFAPSRVIDFRRLTDSKKHLFNRKEKYFQFN